jgi:hypothetical protein
MIKDLDPTVDWRVYYFDPATGRTFEQDTINAGQKSASSPLQPVNYKRDVPSPQDWVMVLERVNQ